MAIGWIHQTSELLRAMNFLSRCATRYYYFDKKLLDFGRPGASKLFFSREFLLKKHWGVVPLWGTNLQYLTDDSGGVIDLIERLKIFASIDSINYSMIEGSSGIWYPDFAAVSIASRRVSLNGNLREFYGVREKEGDSMGPYMGDRFFWPDDEQFVIYSDGDNLSFLAGDFNKIIEMLGVSYEFCRREYISYNSRNLSVPDMYLGMLDFCDRLLSA